MICREYGQQPRWRWVRDPIPGSDWRNDGGWAIIQVRGGTFRIVDAIVFVSYRYAQGGGNHPNPLLQARINDRLSAPMTGTNPRGYVINDSVVAADGTHGIKTNFGSEALIDRNKNGVWDTGDLYISGGLWRFDEAVYRIDQVRENYGATYIRWANMRYCR